jgi:hypothetical protein
MRRRPTSATPAANVGLVVSASLALIVALTAACGGSTATESVSGARPGGADAPAGAPGASPGAQLAGGPDMSGIVGDALQSLVDDGTITADQMAAVQEALSEAAPAAPPAQRSDATQTPKGEALQPGDMFADALDALVDDDTLTSAQAEAVSNALADSTRAPPAGGR